MNVCTKTSEWLDDAVDGRLEPEARAAFDAHVRQCASCAAELEFATSLRASLLRVGFDPAPSGLRGSIAAEIRQLDREPRPATAPRSAPPPRTASWLRPPAWLRAAAAVLVLVTIAWFGFRPGRAPAVAAPTDGSPPAVLREKEREKERHDTVALGDRAPVRRVITATPAGSTWAAGAPSQGVAEGLVRGGAASNGEAWDRMRTIAALGPAAVEELNLVLGTGSTPEQRVRQAVMLMLLSDNLPALAEAAGESSALAEIAADADQALGAFLEAPPPAPAVAAEKKKDDAGQDPDSAFKPAHRRNGDSRPASRAAGGDVQASDAVEPVLYVVTGAGVIGRVERLLERLFAERRIKFDQITLKDPDPSARKRELEQEQAGYRIVEADLATGAMNDLLGDIESLDGIRLAPVGKSPAASAPWSAPAASPVARGAAKRGAPAAADRPAAPKPPSIRRLRLILIGR